MESDLEMITALITIGDFGIGHQNHPKITDVITVTICNHAQAVITLIICNHCNHQISSKDQDNRATIKMVAGQWGCSLKSVDMLIFCRSVSQVLNILFSSLHTFLWCCINGAQVMYK
jgi:hypothetical protein